VCLVGGLEHTWTELGIGLGPGLGLGFGLRGRVRLVHTFPLVRLPAALRLVIALQSAGQVAQLLITWRVRVRVSVGICAPEPYAGQAALLLITVRVRVRVGLSEP
jgi:hypothetical protein